MMTFRELKIRSLRWKKTQKQKEMKYKKDRETSLGKIFEFAGGLPYNIVVTDNDNASTI